MRRTIRARAPAKVILFGEHAVNRGQLAVAVSVGLWATCQLTVVPAGPYILEGAGRREITTRAAVLETGARVTAWLAQGQMEAIARLAAADFFAPTKVILATALGEDLPPGMHLTFGSEIPQGAGLGSSAACFAALARALGALIGEDRLETLGRWAYAGDRVAHGGVASALDTQTALLGGLITYDAARGGQRLAAGPGLTLVIGDTGLVAPTAAINARVRAWAEATPAAPHLFATLGLLARLAVSAIQVGDWPQVGLLMTLAHLVLGRIGVSCPALDRLVEAALGAGALGAKLAGSGGGGIMVALASPAQQTQVGAALQAAGARLVLAPPVAVPGAEVLAVEEV